MGLLGYTFSDVYIYIYIYIYIRLKIKPTQSVIIRSLSWHISVLSSTGIELTTLIHCSTNHLALCPAPKPKATQRHPLYICMTYHRVSTWSNTTCATNKTGTAYPSFAQEYTLEFLVGFVLHDLSWLTISEIKISSMTCLSILETGWQMNRICIDNGRIVL